MLATAARNVRVFGSVARGEDRFDSDVDLLVEMQDDRSLLERYRQTLDAAVDELLSRPDAGDSVTSGSRGRTNTSTTR